MISEVDLRDWDKVNFDRARDNAHAAESYYAFGALIDFINQVEDIRDKQIADAKRKIPAILRKGEE